MEPPAFTIKLLAAEDAPILERVDDDVFDLPVQPALVDRYLRDPNNLLAVAILDGVVVGMASALAYLHPDKPLQLFVNEVGVAARCRGQGLGKKLVATILDKGRAMGCTEAWVATEEDNIAARALYSSLEGRADSELAVVYTWPLAEQCEGKD